MSELTEGRSVRTSFRLMSTGARLLLFLIVLLLLAAGGIGGYILGRQLTYSDVVAGASVVQQLQSENQNLNHKINDQATQLVALQSNLTDVKNALGAIMPKENTYNLDPNQSIIVADGRLAIGLVGSPANEAINIKINGKQQSAAAGDVIKVAVDPSTTCEVAVQSFDVFKAVVTASCPKATPR